MAADQKIIRGWIHMNTEYSVQWLNIKHIQCSMFKCITAQLEFEYFIWIVNGF